MNTTDTDLTSTTGSKEFLTMVVAGQLFGIPVLQVQDVLSAKSITRVPLAPKEIAGSLNLRGRIVTGVNLRCKLQMPEAEKDAKTMYVVVDHEGELYSLIVDTVGEVLALPSESFEKTPSTLDPAWRELSLGIYRLEEKLLVILDVPGMLKAMRMVDDTAA